MTPFKRFKLRVVMRFARLMGVPVDVNGSYFGAKYVARASTV